MPAWPSSSTRSSTWIGPAQSSRWSPPRAGASPSPPRRIPARFEAPGRRQIGWRCAFPGRRPQGMRSRVSPVDQRYDVLVVGKANVDYLLRGRRLPQPGQSVNGELFQEAPGGKGANQAVGAARLGARVALVARVGNDVRGDSVVEALITEGVEIDHLIRDPTAFTGVALWQGGGTGEEQILSAAGANARLSADDVRAAADAPRSARVVLLQLGIPVAAVAGALRIGRPGGARIVPRPGPPRPLPDEARAPGHGIRPTCTEA